MKILNSNLKVIVVLLLCLIVAAPVRAMEKPSNLKNKKILIYTKNGEGYVHDNIPFAVKALEKLGKMHQFQTDVSDNPAVFTAENLKQYTLILFPSTNNDVFDTDAQRLAFRRYMQAGGGFIGLHSVTGTERNWTWFKRMVGCTFSWHAANQQYIVKVIDANHPTMVGLPKEWNVKDECYFGKELYPGTHVLMAHDVTSLDASKPADAERIKQFSAPFFELYPAAWHQQFDGGHVWVTALGHDKEVYEDPTFVTHILQGIDFVAGQVKKLDYSRAYADSRDTPVRY
ncbi:ThuA domain-containing protein [Sphingobacterium sp. SYP-B4668]|uniref:ThuA domain-containing protein n=1 Tax=Sphingobacterium sp. SYP-B4668 TaxID=2996035 RepID=UPI0022DD25C0|nr:ThuA domain-containing protein [Sphingobacterium sp. SYP-B4668]